MEDDIWNKHASLATSCGLFPSYFPGVYNCCSLTSASVYGQVAHDCCCLWTPCPWSSMTGREGVKYPPLETVKIQQDKALAVLSGVGWGPALNRTPDYTTFRGLFQSTSLSFDSTISKQIIQMYEHPFVTRAQRLHPEQLVLRPCDHSKYKEVRVHIINTV